MGLQSNANRRAETMRDVVKSLEANFRRVPGLSGATVMADGSVALILDVSHLARAPARHTVH